MISITIGREDSNHIILNDPSKQTSAFHAELRIKEDGSLFIFDKSTNGSFVNGTRVPKQTEFPVYRGNEVVFANMVKLNWSQVPAVAASPDTEKFITIGRAADNDIRLGTNTALSRYHAILRSTKNGKYFLFDTSSGGSFVNGTKIPGAAEYEVKRNDKISFANIESLDWKQVPSSKTGSGISFSFPDIKNPKMLWGGATAAIVIIAAVLFFAFYHPDLYEKYNNTVGIIRQDFYFEVDFGRFNSSYAVFGRTEDGKMGAVWSSDVPSQPIQISGTGFFISRDGKIITNRHVAEPWNEDENRAVVLNGINARIAALKAYYASEYNAYIKEGNNDMAKRMSGAYNFFNNISGSDINVRGFSTFMGMALVNNHVKGKADYIPCTTLKVGKDAPVDLALLQTDNKATPGSVKSIFDVDDGLSDKELKPGLKLWYIGYPDGLALADTKEGIKSNYQGGQITRDPDKYEFGHNIATTHGASGSPVFTESGRLAGVHYAGSDEVQSIRFAITANQLKLFVNQSN